MFIAIDIGGTKTEIGFFQSKELTSLVHTSLFPTEMNFEHAIKKMEAEIVLHAGNNNRILGIGVSFPGIVDTDGNLIQGSNIRDYEDKPLKQRLEVFCQDVRIFQDSTCSAIAELIFGDIRSYSKIVHLILGTGLGGTFVKIDKDHIEISPIEPCGLIVHANGRKHNQCVTNGLLEAYVGGGSVGDFYKIDLSKIDDDHNIWEEMSDYLAIGINNINCLLKPEAVIIGGGLGTKRKQALASVIEKVKQYDEFVAVPRVQFTSVQGNSSLLGALALFSVNNLKLHS